MNNEKTSGIDPQEFKMPEELAKKVTRFIYLIVLGVLMLVGIVVVLGILLLDKYNG